MDKVISEFRKDETTLPLFIKPKNGQDSAEFLIQWIEDNKELLKQKILKYGRCMTHAAIRGHIASVNGTGCSIGAVMFRGFKVSKGIEFERAVRQIEPEPSKEYRGVSPRKLVPGTEVAIAISLIYYI